jgi:hypothetical protein
MAKPWDLGRLLDGVIDRLLEHARIRRRPALVVRQHLDAVLLEHREYVVDPRDGPLAATKPLGETVQRGRCV